MLCIVVTMQCLQCIVVAMHVVKIDSSFCCTLSMQIGLHTSHLRLYARLCRLSLCMSVSTMTPLVCICPGLTITPACDSKSVFASAGVFVCVCPGLAIIPACDSKSVLASVSVFVCVCPGLIAVCV
jgi:hypothetical protein